MTDRFERNARTVSLLTLLSRVTGLARDATLSRIFGAGVLMDAFFFAFMIPNLFRRLFGEGALSAAFLPVYSQLQKNDPAVARQVASMIVALLVIVLGGVTVLGEVGLYLALRAGDEANPAVWLMMVMLPYMPLVCLVAILGAMLQVHGRFGPTAAAPVVLNLAIVGVAVGFAFRFDAGDDAQRLQHVGLVAMSVLVAGVIQVAWSLAALRRHAWWTRSWTQARAPVRDVLHQAGPMILGLGVLQLNTFFDGLIASYPATVGDTIFGVAYPLDTGAMAAVSFAQRLYQFPLGVFGIAVATAIFPLLARQVDEPERFAETIRRGLRLVVFIGLPASAGLILVREPLTAAVLQGGQFTLDDTRHVGFVLLGYAPAIWAYSMVHVLTRAFYARGDAKTPVKVAVSVVVLNLALNCTLIWTPLREAGLAWSTAICSTLQALTLLLLLKKRLPFTLGRDVVMSWNRTAIVTAVMVLLVGTAMTAFPDPTRWWQWVAELALLVAVGMLVVFSAAGFLRMPELWWALGRRTD